MAPNGLYKIRNLRCLRSAAVRMEEWVREGNSALQKPLGKDRAYDFELGAVISSL